MVCGDEMSSDEADGGATTWLARLLLVLTSTSPVLVVYGAVLLDRSKTHEATWAFLIALVLLVVCLGLLHLSRVNTSPNNRSVAEPEERDGDSLAFLVAYALPLAAANADATPSRLGVLAFVLVLTLLVWQQQLFHVNPLLACFGYHFFTAKSDSGSKVLVLSRSKVLTTGDLPMIRLSSYLWLHCP